jgi:hypothetical protein
MVATLHISPSPISPQAMADLLCTIVLLFRGKDKYNRDFWAYICIKPSMADAFKQACDSGSINITDFGTILEAGEGAEPSYEVKMRMEHDFGVRHDYEDQLRRAIEDSNRLPA